MDATPAIESAPQSVIVRSVDRNKQSIGLIHEKMQDRYNVVKRLPESAKTLSEAFSYADAYGRVRIAYIGSRYTMQNDSFASAIGGIVGIKTAKLHGFGLNIAAYISQNLPFIEESKRAYDFSDANGDSYIYIAEASLNYYHKSFAMTAGRFVIDTPYANSDDIRMSRNGFEGVWGEAYLSDKLSSQLFWLSRWAGYDSQDSGRSQNEFKPLVENGRGMFGVNLGYRYNKESEIALWYHDIEKLANILYFEINGVYDVTDYYHFDYGMQFASMQERGDSGIGGNVFGAMLINDYRDFFIGIAYNRADVDSGATITDGFGGGPYFTSLNEATIALVSDLRPGKDIDAYRAAIGYDFQDYFSSFEYAFGTMRCGDEHIDEHDIVYTLNIDERIKSQLIFADYKTKGEGLRRIVASIEYNF